MQNIYKKIRDAKYIWIYGAGIVGRHVMSIVNQPLLRIKVEGVAVSQKKEDDRLGSYRIFNIREINTPAEDTLFIIATSQKYQEEIRDALSARGYGNYISWNARIQNFLWGLSGYSFVDRRKNYSKACLVLSGYKEFLWDNVFERLQRFLPDDVEVCLMSSGIYSEKLDEIAANNGWSYLSTEANSVTIIQNIAIELLFGYAKWIYKMDEDMFLTEGCFERMMYAYEAAGTESNYRVGVCSPMIPVNGYGYVRMLDKLGKIGEYEEKFERPLYGGDWNKMIETSPEAAAYMWGLKGDIPQLDKWNAACHKMGGYSICGVRLSIGFILFSREFWDDMDGFDVTGKADMGLDEDKIGYMCTRKSYAIVVAEDAVVGHFSFGKQTEGMMEYYKKNPRWFAIQSGGSL